MRRALAAAVVLISVLSFGAELEEETIGQLPAEAKARAQNVQQYLDDQDLDKMRVELKALETLAPSSATVAYYQGRLAFEDGQYADAVKHFEKAGMADRPGSYLKLAKETLGIVKDHEKTESPHFELYLPKGKDSILAPYALEALEKIHGALAEDLGWTPSHKVRVEFVNNAAELAKVSTLTLQQIRTTGTIAICKFNKLMVTSPKAVIYGYDWQDTLAHEYVHYVVAAKSRNTVPIWLHEGLAKYLESRWRGPFGGAMTPSTLALLGDRVRKNNLVPFEKMHPSMALLPTAEDAATAFAEVFFAIDFVYKARGTEGFRELIDAMAKGTTDKRAVEKVTRKSFPEFEKAWNAHLRAQPFPKDLIPPTRGEFKKLAENAPGEAKKEKNKKSREISFGDFAEVKEPQARKWAHLGELMRERQRLGAATEEYGRAFAAVGPRYESLSNKYALALMEVKRFDDARGVLEKSLVMHPGSGQTFVHLGRIGLRQKEWARARANYLLALAQNPFDPEVQVGLYEAHSQLKEDGLAARAKKAAELLGLDPAELQAALAYLMKDEVPASEGKVDEREVQLDAGATPRIGAEAVDATRDARARRDAGSTP